jgi:hypothetical protein
MYVVEQPEDILTRNDDETSSACHFWCNRTLTVTGPDDRPAGKAVCDPSRSCFEE